MLALASLSGHARTQELVQMEGVAIPYLRSFRSAASADRSGRAAAEIVLGRLRLGDVEDARRELDRSVARLSARGSTIVDAAWTTAAAYWWLRATRDSVAIARHVPILIEALDDATHTGAGPPDFADEAMVVHAMLCLDALETLVSGMARDGTVRGRRAIERWLCLEQRAWRPELGRFAARPNHGARSPGAPDPSVLLPAAAGMLIASGDHMLSHLRTVIDAAPGMLAASPTPRTASLVLAAASQLADGPARTAAWRALERAEAASRFVAVNTAARAVDAALFALTGVRLATGVAVDEDWLRLRPWLPPGVDAAAVRNMLAEGVRFDLSIRRRGAGEDLATNDPELPHGTPALVVRLALPSAAARPLRVVVQGHMLQVVTTLDPGTEFERTLPDCPH